MGAITSECWGGTGVVNPGATATSRSGQIGAAADSANEGATSSAAASLVAAI